jgi:hypothetical protein
MWLCMQMKTYFADGIRKLVDWSKKHVEKLGDYVKKLLHICSCVPFVELRTIFYFPSCCCYCCCCISIGN